MIYGPNYTFLMIPGTDSERIGQFLCDKCGGAEFTPIYGTLDAPTTDKKHKVFTVVRKPYSQKKALHEELGGDSDFLEWIKWFHPREHEYNSPYKKWVSAAPTVFKIEDINDRLPVLLNTLGFGHLKVDFPKAKTYTFTPEEFEFIEEHYKQDFFAANYKIDRRSYA
jgi:hypothetical protein